MKLELKKKLAQKRVWRVRKKITGTADRPRLCVSFTNKHIYAQVIDDVAGNTVASMSTLAKDLREDKLSSNVMSAEKLGALFADKAKSAGITEVVFDRHGRRYHGAVRAFAEAARKSGLKF